MYQTMVSICEHAYVENGHFCYKCGMQNENMKTENENLQTKLAHETTALEKKTIDYNGLVVEHNTLINDYNELRSVHLEQYDELAESNYVHDRDVQIITDLSTLILQLQRQMLRLQQALRRNATF
jgi:azurin